jgi:uncharacterized membrane protein YhhN
MIDINSYWLFFAAASAGIDWAATWFGKYRVMYVFKPATMVFLLLWTFFVSHWRGDFIFIAIGLIFGLLGDILLMLRARFFLGGLAAFMLGQIWYIVALNQTPLPQNSLAYIGGAVILAIAFFPVFEIIRMIRRRKGPKRLISGVILYSLVEGSFLVFSSFAFYKTDWQLAHALLFTCGAAFFVISDIMLGFDRFVRPIPHGRTLVHVTYHFAQFGIAIAALQHFVR